MRATGRLSLPVSFFVVDPEEMEVAR